jgi:hypothetical protein
VNEPITVADVKKLLAPMFAAMLRDRERATLTYRLERSSDGQELADDDRADVEVTWVRWVVLDEEGGSSTLWFDDGPEELVRAVRSDLQDFIAESSFGWGDPRLPRTLT